MSKKTAVVFPGIGYHSDKPLLYYSKKILLQQGYDIIDVKFHGVDKGALKDPQKMKEVFDTAYSESEEQLRNVDFASCEDVVFISKSLGTVIAAAYAKNTHTKAKQVYFTPLEQTFSFAENKNGLVFFGTKDPFMDAAIAEKQCMEKQLTYRIFDSANHSIETGDLATDLRNLTDIMNQAENYIKKNETQAQN